ncbi:MAG TPA: diguanylate cyclase, partial [Polyangiaceae bacterium]|nr:diguanylate cyclase [Polyangiaceae bacterium]
AFVPRQSCGCPASLSASPQIGSAADSLAEHELAHALLKVAARGRTGEGSAAWAGARRIAELLGAVSRGGPSLEGHDLNALWSAFLEGNRDAPTVDEVLSVLESAVYTWRAAGGAEPALSHALRHLRITLLRNWRRLEIERNRHYELAAEANSKISHALAVWRPQDGMSLSWLSWTRVQYACLGLWSKPAADAREPAAGRSLQIVAEYGARGVEKPLGGTSHVPASFPPEQITHLTQTLGEGYVLTLVPVVSSRNNRGLLAVAAPIEIELLDHVGNAGDWANQIGAALERAEIDQQLRKNAFYDALTGLPNRAYLTERLEQLTGDPRAGALAVLFLDLDDFKNINDSKGHEAGDQLLFDIGARLQSAVGANGLVARLGGDEFGILVADLEQERDILKQVTGLQDALRAPFLLDGDAVFTSCTIGVAFRGQDDVSAATLLRAADTAMYRAKLRGRGRYEVFDHGMHTQAVERLRLDSRLRQALENDEFKLAYQPIVSLDSGQPIGAEALIRWQHPEQGTLSPVRFLSVAEDVGLGIPIGQWVLETACRQAKTWQRDDGPPVYVNVNVSAEQL